MATPLRVTFPHFSREKTHSKKLFKLSSPIRESRRVFNVFEVCSSDFVDQATQCVPGVFNFFYYDLASVNVAFYYIMFVHKTFSLEVFPF